MNFSITQTRWAASCLRLVAERPLCNIERLGLDPDDSLVGIGNRRDNLYKACAGLTWQFAPTWSLNPEVLYIRDQSNFLSANYSWSEIWITLRKDFCSRTSAPCAPCPRNPPLQPSLFQPVANPDRPATRHLENSRSADAPDSS